MGGGKVFEFSCSIAISTLDSTVFLLEELLARVSVMRKTTLAQTVKMIKTFFEVWPQGAKDPERTTVATKGRHSLGSNREFRSKIILPPLAPECETQKLNFQSRKSECFRLMI